MSAEKTEAPRSGQGVDENVAGTRLSTQDGTHRDRLLEAIVAEVDERGYEATTVAGVCRRAGTTLAVFGANFAGKADCFLAACQALADTLLSQVRAALESSRDWQDGVRAGLAAFLAYLADHPGAARACMVEGFAAGPEAVQIRDATMRSFVGLFDDFQDRAVDAGATTRALVSEAAVGGVYEIVARRIRDGAAESLPELLPALAYFLLAPVLGRPQARRELTGVDSRLRQPAMPSDRRHARLPGARLPGSTRPPALDAMRGPTKGTSAR